MNETATNRTGNGKLTTEFLLRATLDSGNFDVRDLTEDQARAIERILGILPSLIESARENDTRLGLLPMHVRNLALTVVDDA